LNRPTSRESTSSGRKGYCTETACLHPNNGHKYLGCNARRCKKQWKRCQECRPYRLCATCLDHPGASPYDEPRQLGEIRGWGTPAEPLSASQAAGWAERSCQEWGSIFADALAHGTKFSEMPEVLSTPVSLNSIAISMANPLAAHFEHQWYLNGKSARLLPDW